MMLKLRRLISAPVLVGSIALAAGCGGASNDTPQSSSPAAVPSASGTTTNPTAATVPPARLVGQFTTTLKQSDYPANTPVELHGRPRYLMTVTKDGGPDDAPTLGVTWIKPEDQFVHGTLSVSGSTLTLKDEPCAVEPVGLVTSSYRWTLTKNVLRITTLRNGCADKVFDAILTSRPWKKR